MKSIIRYFTEKYAGDWEKVYSAIENKEQVSITDLVEAEERWKSEEGKTPNYTTIIDLDYPDNFKEIYKPPFSIFSYGNRELMDSNNNLVSIFGEMDLEDYKAVAKVAGENAILVIKGSTKNEKVINDLIDDGIKVVAVCDGKIEDKLSEETIQKIKSEKSLVISEFDRKPESIQPDLNWVRVANGVSLKPVISLKNHLNNIENLVALEIAKNEPCQIYYYSANNEDELAGALDYTKLAQNNSQSE